MTEHQCQMDRIYDPRGISPSVQSRDYKDAAKIVVEATK